MTQEAIYKTPFGFHIDLDKIITISDAKFLDRMGSGGWFVTFTIHVQLRDEPIVYTRELAFEEFEFLSGEHHAIMTDGRRMAARIIDSIDQSKIQAVANLQKQVDELIAAWKARQF